MSCAAKVSEQLQVFALRMKRTAAAEIRLRAKTSDARAELVPNPLQLRPIRREVERLAAAGDVLTFRRRKADEADARVAVGVGLRAGDRAGEAFLAVKAGPRGKQDVAAVERERRPQGFLDRFAAAGRPQNLLHAAAAGLRGGWREAVRRRRSQAPWPRCRR